MLERIKNAISENKRICDECELVMYCSNAVKSNQEIDQFIDKIAKLEKITDDKIFRKYMRLARLMYDHNRHGLITVFEIRKKMLSSNLTKSLTLLKSLREELDTLIGEESDALIELDTLIAEK